MAKSNRVNYAKLVPQDSFLGDYLAYMDAQETPHAFDFWTGVWIMSCAIGRNTIVDRPRAPVYLNLYTILVADSGVTRKSTAIRNAVDFARPLARTDDELVERKLTPELLELRLHKQAEAHGSGTALIAISELVTFMGREKYTESMPTLLTDLYDSPSIRSGGGTIGGGTKTLRNVFVSFLSASTPAWLLRAVNPDVIEGGFTSRVLFIVATKPKRLSAWPTEGDAPLSDRIRERIEGIRAKAGQVEKIAISDGARLAFERWYKSRHIAHDPFRSSFQSREDAHILRLAAFLCINDDAWVIQNTHIIAAIKVIMQVREDGASVFEGTGSNGQFILGIDKLRDKLLAAGMSGLPQKELTKAAQPFMSAQPMKVALEIMLELGMVQKFESIQVSRGRPTTIWRGTSALAQSKALDKIIAAHQPGMQ